MARYIILGEQGSQDLLLVDQEAMTVQRVDPGSPPSIARDGSLDTVQAMRGSGLNLVKGVSVAVAIDDQADPSARWVFQQT